PEEEQLKGSFDAEQPVSRREGGLHGSGKILPRAVDDGAGRLVHHGGIKGSDPRQEGRDPGEEAAQEERDRSNFAFARHAKLLPYSVRDTSYRTDDGNLAISRRSPHRVRVFGDHDR